MMLHQLKISSKIPGSEKDVLESLKTNMCQNMKIKPKKPVSKVGSISLPKMGKLEKSLEEGQENFSM